MTRLDGAGPRHSVASAALASLLVVLSGCARGGERPAPSGPHASQTRVTPEPRGSGQLTPSNLDCVSAAAGADRRCAGPAGGEVLVQANGTDSRAQPAWSHPLRLPSDSKFVHAEFGAANLDRYRAWAQRARIWVGESHLYEAAFVDSEQLIVAASQAEARVRVYDRKSRRLIANHDLNLRPFKGAKVLAWPSGPGSNQRPLFLLGSDAGLGLYDVRTGALVRQVSDRPTLSMRWSPDAQVLVVRTGASGSGTPSLEFYRGGHDLERLGEISFSNTVESWDLSRDNRLLALSFYNEEVAVLDLYTGQELARVPGPHFTGDVSFSPDGRMLAVGGQGLLLVDLVNPARRAFYSYYYNNIDAVRFSPSGDAVATSSFDGRIRIFAYDAQGPSLRLVKTLRHDGQANVYTIEFTSDGNGLLSSSGDQTLRIWGAPALAQPARAQPPRFRTLDEWRQSVSAEILATRPPPPGSMKDGHYYPPSLDGPARPSSIRPGHYACSVSKEYRLRDCTVELSPSGHTLLEFHEGNLVAMKGVLSDDGPVVRYEAWPNGPFIGGCTGCERQPLHAVFRGNGGHFKGVLTFRSYYDPQVPPELPARDIGFEDADDRYTLRLEFKAPLTGNGAGRVR